jgi:bacillithiol biosynthesis cysteine-adding enzyme BshC
MLGVRPVNATCLPFTQIPHTTQLFSDFLYDFPKVRQFFTRPPQFSGWMAEEAGRVRVDEPTRRAVAEVLDRQNRAWGAGPAALANIERLRAGALTIITGQQVGLFGGPLLSMLKAVTAVKLAAEATAAGIPTVPIFWLAAEDHDFAEVSRATLLAAGSELKKLELIATPSGATPVHAIVLGDEIRGLVDEAEQILGPGDLLDTLRESYQPGGTLVSAFAKLYARLFESAGLILLDPSDAELHRLAAPVFAATVTRAAELNGALLERGKQLVAAGYHEQVRVTASSVPLFWVRDGQRLVVQIAHRNGDVGFEIGREKVSSQDLLQRVAEHPEQASASALLRPLMQDHLLPVLAYVGGPAEVAYFAQTAVLYERLLGRITPVLPRISATLLEPKVAAKLARYRLTLPDFFHGEVALAEKLGAQAVSDDLQAAFSAATRGLAGTLEKVRHGLAKLDPTLVEAAQQAEAKMQYQLNRLHSRAAQAELRRDDVLRGHAVGLSHALFPEKELQERTLAGVTWVARHGFDLVPRLLEAVRTDCVDHQLVSL